MSWLALAAAPLRKARFVDDVPDDVTWRQLHRLADAELPGLLRDVTRILGEVGVSLPRDEVAALLNAGDRIGLEQLLRQTWQTVGERGLQETLAPRLRDLAVQAAEATTLASVEVGFNVADPEALAAIDAATGARITAISETTREAVQGIVRQAFEAGTPLTQQISEISEVVGLTPRQAEAVARYRQGLVEAGEKPGRIEALVERRARALKRQRAESIARTESLNSVATGAHERLRQSIKDGLVDPGQVRRFWIPAFDERTCPICSTIPSRNAGGVGASQPFDTVVGPIMYPTAHPMCRCTITLKVGDL